MILLVFTAPSDHTLAVGCSPKAMRPSELRRVRFESLPVRITASAGPRSEATVAAVATAGRSVPRMKVTAARQAMAV